MGNTPNFALPYPELTDPADVPADIKRLADAVDPVLLGDYVSLVKSTGGTATAATPIPMDTVEKQVGTHLTPAAAAGTVQATRAGVYLLAGFINNPNTDLIFGVAVQAGGTGAWTNWMSFWMAAGSGGHTASLCYPFYLNASDKVALTIGGVGSATISSARLIVASR